MNNGGYSISIIIPAYNEEPAIESSVLKSREAFESLGLDYEIIIVDDKSADGTGDIADSLVRRFSNIKCLHHQSNTGIGGAFKTGIGQACKEYVMLVPVDNPIDVQYFASYMPRMGVCDIIVGVRIERVGYSMFARFASFVYNRILIPLLFNIGIGDVNWIQIYRRNLFSENVIIFDSMGIFFLVEILIRAKRKRLIVAEVPARMSSRMYGRATNTRFGVMLRTLHDMFRFFLTVQREEGLP